MRSMWLCLSLLVFAADAVGQCPVQIQQAWTDAHEKNVSVHLYNGSNRTIRAIQFRLAQSGVSDDSLRLATYAFGHVLLPKHKAIASFHARQQEAGIANMMASSSVDVLITQIQFADLTTWTPRRGGMC